MEKSFTNEQTIYTLRKVGGGTSVTEMYRELGIIKQTFYRWKCKFIRTNVAELPHLRQLEDENKNSSRFSLISR